MFTCGVLNERGEWILPPEKVERWQRQMETDYNNLPHREKESDVHQAQKIVGWAHEEWGKAPSDVS